jgi:Na+/phosphate symporter
MEEKELTQKLYEMFGATISALENISNGFLKQDQTTLEQGEQQFVTILSSNLSFFEKIAAKEQKNEVDKKFLTLLVPLQNQKPYSGKNIGSGMETIIEMADRCALTHEGRLIAGICMPKASYLYLSLIASFKKVAEELVNFSERIADG